MTDRRRSLNPSKVRASQSRCCPLDGGSQRRTAWPGPKKIWCGTLFLSFFFFFSHTYSNTYLHGNVPQVLNAPSHTPKCNTVLSVGTAVRSTWAVDHAANAAANCRKSGRNVPPTRTQPKRREEKTGPNFLPNIGQRMHMLHWKFRLRVGHGKFKCEGAVWGPCACGVLTMETRIIYRKIKEINKLKKKQKKNQNNLDCRSLPVFATFKRKRETNDQQTKNLNWGQSSITYRTEKRNAEAVGGAFQRLFLSRLPLFCLAEQSQQPVCSPLFRDTCILGLDVIAETTYFAPGTRVTYVPRITDIFSRPSIHLPFQTPEIVESPLETVALCSWSLPKFLQASLAAFSS